MIARGCLVCGAPPAKGKNTCKECYAALTGRSNKYGNKKTAYAGKVFDSKAEAERYQELTLLEAAGEITHLNTQTPVPLIVNRELICTWIPDYEYREKGRQVWEDTKGKITDVARIKMKLAKALYPETTIRVWKKPNKKRR